jgi:hypothetical protein
MGWLLQIAIGVCLIILCGGLVNWVNLYLETRRHAMKKRAPEEEGLIAQRLEEIERRLTDVQDVMIALSEKFDRLEEGVKP